MFRDRAGVDEAFRLLAERLQFEEAPPVALLVGGGSALDVLGLVSRTTKDVDVIALVEGVESGGPAILKKADPLPEQLAEASHRVARDLGLPEDWLNPGPTSLLDFGLPHGCLERSLLRAYGASLRVYFVNRIDQIHFKLFAAVDQGGGRHLTDLLALEPTSEDLLAAARWTVTHDPSPGFRESLTAMLIDMGQADVAKRL